MIVRRVGSGESRQGIEVLDDGLEGSAADGTTSRLHARFDALNGGTSVGRLHEAGALRLRRCAGDDCDVVVVNTGGGIVGGDRHRLAVELRAGTRVQFTTAAAEKVYRSLGPSSRIDIDLRLEEGAHLDWLPQETILFDRAILNRRIEVRMSPTSKFLAVESVVFGRLAMGEVAVAGHFGDSWRVRLGERLIYAEETRLSGDVAGLLDRPALAAGARASSLLLFVGDDLDERVSALARDYHPPEVACGFSQRNKVLIGRYLSPSPASLKNLVARHVAALSGRGTPRAWA